MIYHLALPEEWEAAKVSGSYVGSTRGKSLADEGYVHCSDRDQLPWIVANFYSDLGHVVLLTIDETGLDVRYEAVEGVRYPHLYSALPVSSVFETQVFSPASGQAAPVNV